MGTGALIPLIQIGWGLAGELNLVFSEPPHSAWGTAEGV